MELHKKLAIVLACIGLLTACSDPAEKKPIIKKQSTGKVSVYGPVANADFTIVELESGARTVVARGSSSFDEDVVLRSGLIEVDPGRFEDDVLYLISVNETSNGRDVDHDLDDNTDASPTVVQHPVHLLARGDQLRTLNWRVSPLSELVYQYLEPFLADPGYLDFVESQLDVVAQRLLLNTNCPGADNCVSYEDLLAWNPFEDRDQLSRDVALYDAFSAQLIIGAALTDTQLGNSIAGAAYSPHPLASDAQQAACYQILREQSSLLELTTRYLDNTVKFQELANYSSLLKFSAVDSFGFNHSLIVFYGAAAGFVVADASKPEALQPLAADSLLGHNISQARVTSTDEGIYLALIDDAQLLSVFDISNVLTAHAQPDLLYSQALSVEGVLVASYPLVLNVQSDVAADVVLLSPSTARSIIFAPPTLDPVYTPTALALQNVAIDAEGDVTALLWLAHDTGVVKLNLVTQRLFCSPGSTNCAISHLEVSDSAVQPDAPQAILQLEQLDSSDNFLAMTSSSLISLSATGAQLDTFADNELDDFLSFDIDGNKAIVLANAGTEKRLVELTIEAFPALVSGLELPTTSSDFVGIDSVLITTDAFRPPAATRISSRDSLVQNTVKYSFDAAINGSYSVKSGADYLVFSAANAIDSFALNVSDAMSSQLSLPLVSTFFETQNGFVYSVDPVSCNLEVFELSSMSVISDELYIGCDPTFIHIAGELLEIGVTREIGAPDDTALVQLNIADPTNPTIEKVYLYPLQDCTDQPVCMVAPLDRVAGGLRSSDHYIFLDFNELYLSEVDPLNENLLSGKRIGYTSSTTGVFAALGDYLYVSDGISTLDLYHIGSLNDYAKLDTLTTNAVLELVTSSNYLYAAEGLYGVAVYDLADPAAPLFRHQLNFADNIIKVVLLGDKLYALSETALYEIPALQ